jgi:hypothetical protein
VSELERLGVAVVGHRRELCVLVRKDDGGVNEVASLALKKSSSSAAQPWECLIRPAWVSAVPRTLEGLSDGSVASGTQREIVEAATHTIARTFSRVAPTKTRKYRFNLTILAAR